MKLKVQNIWKFTTEWAFPNRLAFFLCPIGMSVELSLMASEPKAGLLRADAVFIPLVFMYSMWFWFTAVHFLHRVVRLTYASDQRSTMSYFRVCVFYPVASVLVFVAIVASYAYAVSWVVFFQTGRFANWEAVRFFMANSQDLWLHVSQAEPRHLTVALLALPFVVAAWLILATKLGKRVNPPPPSQHPVAWLWICLSIGTYCCYLTIMLDTSESRPKERRARIEISLHPTYTLLTSAIRAMRSETIEAVLKTDELQSLSTDWSPPHSAGNVESPSIIIIAIESLRHDVIQLEHQGHEVTPNINGLAQGGVEWSNAYSQSTHSDYADVCIVSSLYPLRSREHLYYSRNDPWPKTLVYDLLKRAGYKTAIISSQNEAWGNMDQFLETPSLDYFFHPQRATKTDVEVRTDRDPGFQRELDSGNLTIGKFPDWHTVDTAIAWIKRQHSDMSPFFLSINLQSSHFPYPIPDDAARPFAPANLDADIFFMSYPPEKAPMVRNAYYNALHEADRQVGRVIECIHELQLDDNIILMVLGENGEAFHENGTVGHAREPFEPCIHVATIMWGPSYFEPLTIDYPLEHIDIAPIILGRIGWPSHPNFQGIDALSNQRPNLEDRFLFFHVNNGAARADALQYAGRWKYMWSFDYGRGYLFDLRTDPQESNDLSLARPELARMLRQKLETWRKRQLAYYCFPHYYQAWYPPRAVFMGTD